MTKKKITDLTGDELVDLWREEGKLLSDDGETVLIDAEVVEEGDWYDDGKFQDMDVVVKDADGTHYQFNIIRSGSYFTYYEYECYDTADEVMKVTETITRERWVLV